MSELIDLAARIRNLPSLLAGVAVALALFGQLQFSRGPNNLREGIVSFLVAIGCFVAATWLHDHRAITEEPSGTPAHSASESEAGAHQHSEVSGNLWAET